MVLLSAVTGTRIDLKWNNPLPAAGALFTVWRETGQGWKEVASNLSDTTWSDDYSLFAAEVSVAEVAYQVTALATDAPGGTSPHRSSVATIQLTENIFVPNAFTPDRGIENAIFKPEFSFVPVKYEFRIYTRTGAMLFQTSDFATGWDGRHSGSLLPSGVYLWSLRLTTPSGRMVVRNGTVTILP
ncbi:MAG: gliding motility-associated C-terminal domain-containing protein [Bacteroidales bacterium]|nr:gliding motility-associated C-terminal domain-containing protein [Bacteroidales bacterium]